LTNEDWRNREKWPLYEEAVNEMLLKTSTITAPWTVIEGDSKLYARVKIVRTMVETLSKELDYDPFKELALKDEQKKKKRKKKNA
jgi:polyphosphate kinase 2 (PPK2 family)